MKALPIWNERALFIPEIKAIVIADLHIGIEFDYYLQGVNIVTQTKNLLEKCKKLIKEKDAKKLIIVGDLKHVIAGKGEEKQEMIIKERKEVRYFLKEVSKLAEIWIVKGNHDGRLFSKRAKIYGARGFKIKDVAFLHGHAWPSHEIMHSKLVIMGHLHPFIRIKTRVGYSYLEPCWIKGEFKKGEINKRYGIKRLKFIVMPAFNPLCGGIAINREKIDIAITKIMDIDNADVFLLNGINLGRVRNLR